MSSKSIFLIRVLFSGGIKKKTEKPALQIYIDQILNEIVLNPKEKASTQTRPFLGREQN